MNEWMEDSDTINFSNVRMKWNFKQEIIYLMTIFRNDYSDRKIICSQELGINIGKLNDLPEIN